MPTLKEALVLAATTIPFLIGANEIQATPIDLAPASCMPLNTAAGYAVEISAVLRGEKAPGVLKLQNDTHTANYYYNTEPKPVASVALAGPSGIYYTFNYDGDEFQVNLKPNGWTTDFSACPKQSKALETALREIENKL